MSSNTPPRFTIPILEKCCCLQLKTGGITVAVLWMIPLLFAVVVTTWEMFNAAISRSHIGSSNHSEIMNITEELETLESWHDSFIAQYALAEAFVLTLLATCLLHIYGAFMEKRLFMVPFITLLGLSNTVIIFSETMRILLLTTNWIGFLITIVLAAAGLYSFLVLVSYYVQLKQKPSSSDEDDVVEAIEDALW